jgi:hypothetical protein
MRKPVLLYILAVLVLASCTRQKAEYVRMISLGASEKVLECPVEYSECEFHVYADEYLNSKDCSPIGYEAEILDDASWISFGDNGTRFINKKGSGALRLRLDANSGLRRSARVVLRAEGRTDTLSVRQEGVYREYIRLKGEYDAVPAEGGTYEALVETNVLPAFLKVSGSAGIDDCALAHNVVTFVVGPSPSRDRRNLTVTVSTVDGWGETVSGSVTLQQEPGR